jgi:GPH family glycoside/pentoside/hexuronide:cation symporter
MTNRRWHLANALTFLNFMVFCTQGGMAIHYTRFVLHKPAEYASFILTAPLAAAFIGAISVSRLTARFGIRRTYLVLMVWEMVCQCVIFMSGDDFAVTLAAMIVQYLAVGAVSPLCFSILSEAVDQRRARTGVAAAGLAFSINALVGKVSAGIAGFAIASFLAWGDYRSGLEVAGPELVTWLKAGFIGLPTLAVVLAFLIAFPSADDRPRNGEVI